MTMELLKRIIEVNNIPKNVHYMSDSGCECDSTEMDAVYYNIQSNTIVFTQGHGLDREYHQSEEWEILYCPELIKIQELEIYPVRVLKRFVDIAFTDGLVRASRDKSEKETVSPKRLVSTVRVENEFSKKMMLACGFRENKEIAHIFRIIIGEDDSVAGTVEVSEFVITKEEYLNPDIERIS